MCVVQQPLLHRRTCLTWEKQAGVAPVGWTVSPTEAKLGRPLSELCRYALGEYQRIPSYAKDKGFCVMPKDFPAEAAGMLKAGLEAALEAETGGPHSVPVNAWKLSQP